MRSCTVRRSLRKPLRSSSQASSSIVPQPAVAQVIDVVDFHARRTGREVQQVTNRGDQIIGPKGHFQLGHIQLQLAVDAEAADLTQAIAVRIEELFVEQGAGLFQLRRIARP